MSFTIRPATRRRWRRRSCAAGQARGLELCGLGARDSLRLEAGYPLYGHELTREISPLTAGLGWTVKLDKEVDFVGRAALAAEKREGSARRVVFFRTGDRRIVRPETPVADADGAVVGRVLSGTLSPILVEAIGTALVEAAASARPLHADVRGSPVDLRLVKPPIGRTKESPMSNIPPELRYAKSHEWLRLEADGTARSASPTTRRSRSATSPIVQLPKVGAAFKAGASLRRRRIGQGGVGPVCAGRGHGPGRQHGARQRPGDREPGPLRGGLDPQAEAGRPGGGGGAARRGGLRRAPPPLRAGRASAPALDLAPLGRLKDPLAQAQVLRRHLDELVRGDVLDRALERELGRRASAGCPCPRPGSGSW